MFKAKIDVKPIPLKKAAFVEDIPTVKWTEQEINRMNIIESLQYSNTDGLSFLN